MEPLFVLSVVTLAFGGLAVALLWSEFQDRAWRR
jgi:hypothetical protein